MSDDVVAELDAVLEEDGEYAYCGPVGILKRARDEIVALRRGIDAQIAARKAAEVNADAFMVSNGALTEEVLALRGQGPGDAIARQIHDEARAEALEEAAKRALDLDEPIVAAAIRALKQWPPN